jgi:hypothetical protein
VLRGGLVAGIVSPLCKEIAVSKKKKEKHDDIAEMLQELATLDLVEAEVPTVAEHTAGVVPPWCELRLKIRREQDDATNFPLNIDIPLRRHDGELIIEVIHDVLHRKTGVAGELIWAELDACVERIMKRRTKGKEPRDADIAEAMGLSKALAYLANPMQPELDDIKWAATERWNIRHADD